MASSELLENEKLAIEMASVSVANSQEIVQNAASTTDLSNYQNALIDQKDRVQAVKDTLLGLKEHEVTPSLVNALDRSLERSEVTVPPVDGVAVVEGAESLGRTLMPKDYIFTRLVGCESFLDDFFKKTKEITSIIGSKFKESYILFTESEQSLLKQIDILEQAVNTSPPFNKDPERVLLGSRLFNLFKTHGKVSENWVDELGKLSRSVNGLTSNYYLNSRNNLTAIMGYFGGFSGLNQTEAEERFKLLGVSIPSTRFKECTYPNRKYSVPGGTAKQSVELMGGAYFYDVRQDKPIREVKSILEVEDVVNRYNAIDCTGFDDSEPTVFSDLDLEIKTLTIQQIKAVIKQLRDIHKDWVKVYEGVERYKLSDSDFNDIAKGIYEAEFDEKLKDKIFNSFIILANKNQMELLKIRSKVNAYLVLINSGLIELCFTSIKVNTP